MTESFTKKGVSSIVAGCRKNKDARQLVCRGVHFPAGGSLLMLQITFGRGSIYVALEDLNRDLAKTLE